MAREAAAEEAAIAPAMPPPEEEEETWPAHAVDLGCLGGGDPFVGVELSDERPESSRPSSPIPFSWHGWTRTRVGRPVVRRRAPFEPSDDGEAILERAMRGDRQVPSFTEFTGERDHSREFQRLSLDLNLFEL